jgi:hypothetical protein
MLGFQHFYFLYLWRIGEQFVGVPLQRAGDFSLRMRLSTLLVGEGVVDAERRFVEPEREPRRRIGFILGQRKGRTKELLDVVLFPVLCFESCEQGVV